ncbi:unnamed protein product [Fusarium langsethiae]|nr:unnamed protein product [Fusarium langsethiae]
MVAFKFLLMLLALGVEGLAALNPTSTCSTALGTKSVRNVPTSRAITVNKVTVVKKVIRKVNFVVILVAKTSTIRETEIHTSTVIADQATKTATSTIISSTTSFIERTVWSSVNSATTTTTTKYVTSTIEKPPGFTDILNQPRTVKRRNQKKRDVKNQTIAPGGTYPQSVRCVKEVPTTSTKTITTTVQGARKTAKAVTKLKTTTISTAVVTTQCPDDASTTVFTTEYPVTTSVVDVTAVTTVVSTVTIESQVPQAIEYSICSSDNLMVTDNDGGYLAAFDNYQRQSGVQYLGIGHTANSCCNACVKLSNCQGSYYVVASRQCSIYLATDAKSRRLTVVLSNGLCGQWRNGGSLD